MADRRALVTASPGSIGLEIVDALVPAAGTWRAIGRGSPKPGKRVAVTLLPSLTADRACSPRPDPFQFADRHPQPLRSH